jgi:hypothetical protein
MLFPTLHLVEFKGGPGKKPNSLSLCKNYLGWEKVFHRVEEIFCYQRLKITELKES